MNKKPRYFFVLCSAREVKILSCIPSCVSISKKGRTWKSEALGPIALKVAVLHKVSDGSCGIFDRTKPAHIAMFIKQVLLYELGRPNRTKNHFQVVAKFCNLAKKLFVFG